MNKDKTCCIKNDITSVYILVFILKIPKRKKLPLIRQLFTYNFLFPFYGCWWFRADVISHTVDPFYFINNSVRNQFQKLIRQF